MRIAVIGATGMVGSRIVTEAADRDHHVIAASRTALHQPRSGVTSTQADASNATDLDSVLERADAVVLTVRVVPGEEDAFITITEAVLAASASADTPSSSSEAPGRCTHPRILIGSLSTTPPSFPQGGGPLPPPASPNLRPAANTRMRTGPISVLQPFSNPEFAPAPTDAARRRC